MFEIIISFITGLIVGALCMGLASGHHEEEQIPEEPEVSVNPCTNCTKLCGGRARRYCCDWCKWIYDYNPPCDKCELK